MSYYSNEYEFFIKDGELINYSGKSPHILIPPGVKKINDGVFKNKYWIKSVTIPEGVITIGDGVFDGCNVLEIVKLPKSLSTIGDSAFRKCILLHTIDTTHVKNIGSRAFEGCDSLSDSKGFVIVKDILFSYVGRDRVVAVPDGVRVIDKYAFNLNKEITSVYIPEGVTEIGYAAFWFCSNLESVTLPDSLNRIDSYAFHECKALKHINISSDVRYIGQSAFDRCYSLADENGCIVFHNVLYQHVRNYGKAVITDGVVFIRANAFDGDSRDITEIVIPDSVRYIEDYAFTGCASLNTINFPRSIEYIGNEAFLSHVFRTSLDTSGVFTINTEINLSTRTLGKAVPNRVVTDVVDLIPELWKPRAVLAFVEGIGTSNPRRTCTHLEYIDKNTSSLIPSASKNRTLLDFLLARAEVLLTREDIQICIDEARKRNELDVVAKLVAYELKNYSGDDMDDNLKGALGI